MSICSCHASLGKLAAPLHLPLLVQPVPQAITRGHGTQQWSGGSPWLECVHWYFLHPLPSLCFSFRKQVAYSTEKAIYLRHNNPASQTTWSEPVSLVTWPLCSVQTIAKVPTAPAPHPAGLQQTSLRAQARLRSPLLLSGGRQLNQPQLRATTSLPHQAVETQLVMLAGWPAFALTCSWHSEFTSNLKQMAHHTTSSQFSFLPSVLAKQKFRKMSLSLFYNRKIYPLVSRGLAEESMFCAVL